MKYMNLRKKLLKIVAVMYGCTALLSFGMKFGPQDMVANGLPVKKGQMVDSSVRLDENRRSSIVDSELYSEGEQGRKSSGFNGFIGRVYKSIANPLTSFFKSTGNWLSKNFMRKKSPQKPLPQKRVDDMRQVLQDVGVEKNLIERIQIEPMSQEDLEKGWDGVCKRKKDGALRSINLSSNCSQKLLYHEAIHAKRHEKSPSERKYTRCYRSLLSKSQKKVLPPIKFKKMLGCVLVASVSLLAKDSLGPNKGKNLIKTGLTLTSVGMGIGFAYDMVKNIKIQNPIHLIQKESNYLLGEISPGDNIIERLTQSFSESHDCQKPCLHCYAFPYSIGKCIRMKEEFEAEVGALAMVSDKNGDVSYIDCLKNKIKQGYGWERLLSDEYPSAYEQVIYAEDLMRARKQGEDCLEGLASCADKYLQERIRGTLRDEAEQYSTIEEHIKARREKEELDFLLS